MKIFLVEVYSAFLLIQLKVLCLQGDLLFTVNRCDMCVIDAGSKTQCIGKLLRLKTKKSQYALIGLLKILLNLYM